MEPHDATADLTGRLVLADKILADCSQNRQSTKINSPPKFLAVQYVKDKTSHISYFKLFIACLGECWPHYANDRTVVRRHF